MVTSREVTPRVERSFFQENHMAKIQSWHFVRAIPTSHVWLLSGKTLSLDERTNQSRIAPSGQLTV